jgi:hypothetical protein
MVAEPYKRKNNVERHSHALKQYRSDIRRIDTRGKAQNRAKRQFSN